MTPRQPPRKPPRARPRPSSSGASGASTALPRALRHMRAGVVVLTLVGIVVVAIVLVRMLDLRRDVDPATETAKATVVASRDTDSALLVDVRWTDGDDKLTGTLRFPADSEAPDAGDRVEIAYDPDDPDRVHAAGDATLSALSNLAADILLILAVVLAVNVATAVRWLRRRRLTASGGVALRVRRIQVRHRLVEQSYLVTEGRVPIGERGDAGEDRTAAELWVPVYWDPALERIGADGEDTATVTAYGRVSPRRLVGFAVDAGDGTEAVVWPSGGVKAGQPRGVVREGPSGQDGPVSMRRQFRVDAGLLFPAPALGLLWAFVDESGVGGFVLSTVFFVGVLAWLPSYYGSDPT